MEFTIVTSGVLIALFLSNLKENSQAQEYHQASIETINKEIGANYSDLTKIVESHKSLLDTLKKYASTKLVISEIIIKAGGVQASELKNTGFDLYKRNQINLIDFDMMSTLNSINYMSKLIDSKLEKLMTFAYLNILDNSKKNKIVLSFYIRDIIASEESLLRLYKKHMDENEKSKEKK